MTAKKKPSAPAEPPAESAVLDLPAILLDVLVDHAKPVTAPELVKLTGVSLPQVTEALDDLVSEGLASLSDDGCYVLTAPPEPEPAPVPAEEALAGPEVTIEFEYDDLASDLSDGKMNVVLLPTSDLLRFLTNINLPPQLIAGLGALSELKGVLSYEPVDPTPDDPRPSRTFRVSISGRHVGHLAALNPNQPGYVSEGVALASFVEDQKS